MFVENDECHNMCMRQFSLTAKIAEHEGPPLTKWFEKWFSKMKFSDHTKPQKNSTGNDIC